MKDFNRICECYNDFLHFATMLVEDYGCAIEDINDIDNVHILCCPECDEPIYFCDMLNEDVACPACGFNGLQEM